MSRIQTGLKSQAGARVLHVFGNIYFWDKSCHVWTKCGITPFCLGTPELGFELGIMPYLSGPQKNMEPF